MPQVCFSYLIPYGIPAFFFAKYTHNVNIPVLLPILKALETWGIHANFPIHTCIKLILNGFCWLLWILVTLCYNNKQEVPICSHKTAVWFK